MVLTDSDYILTLWFDHFYMYTISTVNTPDSRDPSETANNAPIVADIS